MTIRTFFSLAVVLAALSLPMPFAAAGSAVFASAEVVNFGFVKQGEPIEVDFTLENRGDVSRMIRFMGFSVPGMVAQVNPRIAPGASTLVTVRWDSSNLAGAVVGEIKLEFDGPGDESIAVEIRGQVLPAANGSSD